jgi:hypothetical protein
MPNQYTTPNLFIRFWAKVNITADDNKCWEWNASRDNLGYGKFKYKYKAWPAHRLIWFLLNGEIPHNFDIFLLALIKTT